MAQKLFAVYLGGRAPKCNTELHDVVFVAGETVEATYEQLLDKWFGSLRVHIDSWIDLSVVDGWRVTLRPELPAGSPKLYFINLGAYRPGEFTELHANTFLVAASSAEATVAAKANLLLGTDERHTDDLFDVDDCLEISEIGGVHVHLEPAVEKVPLIPHNGYQPIPLDVRNDYARRHGLPLPPR